eukprot:INCI17256.4.p1 GENE.INCI17256.4~~INCI17256.4.p1  ORF type:complete len:536 (+),score=71.19 INCI17256.4:739-2346(+)
MLCARYIEDTLQLSLSLSAVNWQERTYVLASKSSMHTNAHDASFTEPVCNPATDFFAFRAESGAHDFIRSVACNCAGMSCDALAGGIQASAAKESAERHSLSCSSFGDASAAAITFPPQMQCQVRDKLPVCANSPVPLGSQIQGSGIDRPHFDMCGYHQGGAEFISCGILNSMQTVALQRFSTFSSGIVDNAQPLILGQSRRSRIRQHEFEVATRNAADLLWRTDSVVLNTCCESFQTPISKRIQQVAILVPSTTRGSFLRHPADVPSLPLFQNLLRTLVLTTSLSAESGCSSRRASSEQFAFHVYVGFDPGDPFYDVSTNRAAVMEYFKKTTSFAALSLHNSGLEHFFSPAVLNTTSTIFSDIQSDVRLTLVRVSGASGAPAWIWNHLAWKAVDEGADFLYQTNDDMEFQTACWANEFVASLQSRFPVVNLGVAAPEDAGNKRVVTQSFVHRTHVEIFGVYYHPVFKNWFSDDWITRVYGLNITAMLRHQKVHNTQIYGTRYSIKRNDGTFLEPAVVQGHYMLREWLQSHSTPA